MRRAGGLPGVVALAATDAGIAYEGVFGRRRADAGPAMTRDTVFRIASMVKLMTSIAALQLVEQGRLSLDAPVPDIKPELGSPRCLTDSTRRERRSCARPNARFRSVTC